MDGNEGEMEIPVADLMLELLGINESEGLDTTALLMLQETRGRGMRSVAEGGGDGKLRKGIEVVLKAGAGSKVNTRRVKGDGCRTHLSHT